MDLILASGSPRRRELLQRADEVGSAHCGETLVEFICVEAGETGLGDCGALGFVGLDYCRVQSVYLHERKAVSP